ncbi:zinc finger FYVE domain-containing protein 21-like [Paramacrobiotus metropolitanus]|uniref:zinc finger FYVE domain-containing protein 21-like n=1 Tax=Paramacrobiotus metropolitanus TaxID=2943436 RepID=UPI002445DE36|nr:zinc finger FYVE domain-containing protein 21-like [Paramacrobiotus metropolitanus]
MFFLINFAGIMRHERPAVEPVCVPADILDAENDAVVLVRRKKNVVHGKSGVRWTGLDLSQSPLYLPEPRWIPDEAVAHCRGCGRRFDFLRRKHHCRRCGEIFCGTCCGVKAGLRRMGFVDNVRQCQRCADISRKENVFFDTHLLPLEQGGHFYVQHCGSNHDPSLSKTTFRVRMSCNHRWISFDAYGSLPAAYTRDVTHLEPLRTSDIVETRFLHFRLEYYAGTVLVPGMLITYRQDERLMQLCLQASLLPDLDESRNWLLAMQQADLMLAEPTTPANPA